MHCKVTLTTRYPCEGCLFIWHVVIECCVYGNIVAYDWLASMVM